MGASSGIGLTATRALASAGSRVIVVERDASTLGKAGFLDGAGLVGGDGLLRRDEELFGGLRAVWRSRPSASPWPSRSGRGGELLFRLLAGVVGLVAVGFGCLDEVGGAAEAGAQVRGSGARRCPRGAWRLRRRVRPGRGQR